MSLLLLFFLLSNCSSLPEGEGVLTKMVEEDQGKVEGQNEQVYRGRPIFVKVTAYPQMLAQGDIFAGGEILLSVGREELSLEEILK